MLTKVFWVLALLGWLWSSHDVIPTVFRYCGFADGLLVAVMFVFMTIGVVGKLLEE